MANVLVVCETREGQLKKGSRELLTIGREIAAAAGGELQAAAFGSEAEGVAAETGNYGAGKLFVVAHDSLNDYLTGHWAGALENVIAESKPSVVLISASAAGKDLAPRVAARLGAGVASEVVELSWSEGALRGRRPVYSGKAIASFEIDSTPAIATCRANSFPPSTSGGGAAAVEQIAWEPSETNAKLIETRTPEAAELSIAEAEVIVSGGRGLKEPENFSYIRNLAAALGAAVGASRATVDAGWIDHQHQVGQTGRVVSPNLYIAAGISGAIQHLAGMQSSKHIVAINKDAEAPIFKVADLGVVGDLFEILPALTEEVKKAKAAS